MLDYQPTGRDIVFLCGECKCMFETLSMFKEGGRGICDICSKTKDERLYYAELKDLLIFKRNKKINDVLM